MCIFFGFLLFWCFSKIYPRRRASIQRALSTKTIAALFTLSVEHPVLWTQVLQAFCKSFLNRLDIYKSKHLLLRRFTRSQILFFFFLLGHFYFFLPHRKMNKNCLVLWEQNLKMSCFYYYFSIISYVTKPGICAPWSAGDKTEEHWGRFAPTYVTRKDFQWLGEVVII